ncbi:MAG: hypothetical protein HKO57_09935, partial [Akkermansiaceae bacterium]|nr:hypothetical protein [Akkermansiaceae bacterium]
MPTRPNRNPRSEHRISVEGSHIRLITPEGTEAAMPIRTLFEEALAPTAPAGGAALPKELVMILTKGPGVIWVLEFPPALHYLRWIAADSPAPYGPEATYRQVTLALPYVLVFGIFVPRRGGLISLADDNEAFFRNAPLRSGRDELLFPALLNCSKFASRDGTPLSWICTQHLERSFDATEDPGERMRLAMDALVRCFFHTGFNYSSEQHEGSSWFTESRGVDPRIATVEAWEDASKTDPLFALDVPWIPTGHTVH